MSKEPKWLRESNAESLLYPQPVQSQGKASANPQPHPQRFSKRTPHGQRIIERILTEPAIYVNTLDPVRDGSPLELLHRWVDCSDRVLARDLAAFCRMVTVDIRTNCWLVRSFDHLSTYSNLRLPGRRYAGLAHRWIFTVLHGEIHAGLVIDHICGQKRCAYPDHLQAVTRSQNALLQVARAASVRKSGTFGRITEIAA